MTTEEFSNEFDTLVSSYRRFKDFDNKEGLDSIEFDEYEKSVFLTKAQEELITAYYSGRNSNLYSFEKTEEVRRYLSSLVRTVKLTPNESTCACGLITPDAQVFCLPEDVWFITYEAAYLGDNEDSCLSGKALDVVPVMQDYFHRVKRNPFRGPNDRRALRLDIADKKVELVSKYPISKYLVRYIVKPAPIVLTKLKDVSVDGYTASQTCELEESLHRPILDLAVRLALQSKGINLEKDKNN